MNRKTIIIWGVVILVAIFGIIVTYILFGNNGFSNTINTGNQDNTNNSNTDTGNTILPTESEIESIEQRQGSGDYYYWSIMPLRLQAKLVSPRNNSLLDYYYSSELGIAFSYEVVAIGSDKYISITPPESRSNSGIIYLHIFEAPKESGQSIEVIDVESNYRFNTIPEIINLQILDSEQKKVCTVQQKEDKYSIIAKDTKVKDSTAICGKYAKGNNRFFIKPQQEGTATNKLIFVSAGDKELSYDGSKQGKFWYESVVVE